ncbi:hypothetical protein [Candidatus Nitrospira inopinata]|jgi:hypothetical protein|uniref:Uncharacterized protein n=1 Tax=Candidatus Nitrospira inopinata TaxID=1715989 RepID=A0A0S4KT13_9BACT|nr:hypothetical protein [Candidatus Nitrospira inopinata]CUQ67495.1 conserved exported protein of unknown function [Candidatus Nitrospira inopinata]
MFTRPFISVGLAWTLVAGTVVPSAAIEVQPTDEQIRAALAKGKEAARDRRPPDSLYARFGENDEGSPNGFLMTKLGRLAVMAAHLALRGLEPGPVEIAGTLEEPTMLVTAMIVGTHPSFAVDSYMVLNQKGRLIKPMTVRYDGRASPREGETDRPFFRAKVVAAFKYDEFDPLAETTITVFPSKGEAVSFVLDFSRID